ncbi:MAG: class I SAM-dependent methyltransferase [Anaerolineae bacterium]|nr:MAG: class I SAM-dependent methyltransferase [Anaerolineae bacterium]
MNDRQLSPQTIYQLVADVGFRRHFHLGGLQATRELLARCPLDASTYVLDVGCASGKTACYIAKQYGCRVIGVDRLVRMVERADERAAREGVRDRVSFRVADAEGLPFEDNAFDVVLGEFITGLLADKPRAVSGYVRVVKPGGHVALNEATWVKTPPPKELVEYLAGVFGVQGEILPAEGWVELLEGSGLRDVESTVHEAGALSNSLEDLKDVLRVGHRVLVQYVRSAAFRRFIRETLSVPRNLLEYLGYGIYVGRK